MLTLIVEWRRNFRASLVASRQLYFLSSLRRSVTVFCFFFAPSIFSDNVSKVAVNPALLNQGDIAAQGPLNHFKLFPFTGYHNNPGIEADGKIGWVKYHLRTNNLGFLSKYDYFPFENKWPAKQANEKIVLLTGASTAAGFGATRNEFTISYVLEDLLNQKDPNHKWKVVNLANAGWETYQEMIGLDLYGSEMEADWIIVFDGRGDVVVGTMHGEGTPGYLFFNGQRMLNSLFDNLNEITPSLPIFKYFELSKRLKKIIEERPTPIVTEEAVAKGVSFYLHAIESILIRFKGKHFLLATQPDIDVFRPGSIIDYGYHLFIPKIQQLAQKYPKVQYINPTRLVEPSVRHFADGAHLTNEGQRIMAETFAEVILKTKQ